MGEPKAGDLDSLWARARLLLHEGRLPRVKAVRTWGGSGSGAPCELCGSPILASEPELEIELDLTADTTPTLRFHRQCHALWDAVRAEAAAGWVSVNDNPPPPETVVEARMQLGGGRVVILNVLARIEPQTSSVQWINATTGAALPEGWVPYQWRAVGAEGPPAEVPAGLPRRA